MKHTIPVAPTVGEYEELLFSDPDMGHWSKTLDPKVFMALGVSGFMRTGGNHFSRPFKVSKSNWTYFARAFQTARVQTTERMAAPIQNHVTTEKSYAAATSAAPPLLPC